MKVEITKSNVWNDEHPQYKSILNLLIKFQDDAKGKGLQQKHFRYALCPNHDNINEYDMDRMKRFFGESLKKLIDEKEIVPDCISSRNNLTNFLDRLVNELRMVKKLRRGKVCKYRMKDEYVNESYRMKNHRIIDRYELDWIASFKRDRYNQIVYGIPKDLDIPKKTIQTHLETIQKHIISLEKIRDDALDKRWGLVIKECGLSEADKWWSLFYNIDNDNAEFIQESFKDLFDMEIPDSKISSIRELVIYMLQNRCKKSVERSFKIFDKLMYEIAYWQSIDYENIALSCIPYYG